MKRHRKGPCFYVRSGWAWWEPWEHGWACTCRETVAPKGTLSALAGGRYDLATWPKAVIERAVG